MKILVLYEYPPAPGGLPTQGDLLYHGLLEIGVDAKAAHLRSDLEKEWHYRWFKPDAVVGVGFWGDYPDLVQHPRRFGMAAVPWLLADGFVANYRRELDALPLLLVTANWVKETFERDGIRGDRMQVLPVGCDTDAFTPRDSTDAKVRAMRKPWGWAQTSALAKLPARQRAAVVLRYYGDLPDADIARTLRCRPAPSAPSSTGHWRTSER